MLFWHTDGSWRERTGQATMMYSEIVPPPGLGGQTQFADMYSAYRLLPAAIKGKIEGKRAVHNLDFSRTRRHGEDLLTAQQKSEVPPVAHPIVRTHPETGRKTIFLGDHAEYIEGMDYDEGRALIEDINAMVTPARARLFAHLDGRPMHGVGQPLHPAPRHRLRRSAANARDAPLHHQRRPPVLMVGRVARIERREIRGAAVKADPGFRFTQSGLRLLPRHVCSRSTFRHRVPTP